MKTHEELLEIIRNVRKLAKENPERVYEKPTGSSKCRYLNSSDTPGVGCIFGCALKEHEETLRNADSTLNGVGIFVLLEDLGFVRNNESEIYFRWCSNVQTRQDYGDSWKDSISYADRLFPEVLENTKI